jgi:peroxiredoxin
MPDMEQVYQEKKQDGFTVLAVNIQEARDPVSQFVNRFGLTFPILMDASGEVTQKYGIYSLPSSYFIDREGRITEVNVGALSKAAISRKVEAILR